MSYMPGDLVDVCDDCGNIIEETSESSPGVPGEDFDPCDCNKEVR